MVVHDTTIHSCAALRLQHPAGCEAADPEKSDADSPKDVEDVFGRDRHRGETGMETGYGPADASNPAGCAIHCGSNDPATIPTAATKTPSNCGGQI